MVLFLQVVFDVHPRGDGVDIRVKRTLFIKAAFGSCT